MALKDESLVALRGIAQSYAIANIFSMDKAQLIQEIELKQQGMVREPVVSIPKQEYRSDLMTRPPSRISHQEELVELMQPYVSRGLRLSFPEPEVWAMAIGIKNDTGTMRQPLRNILTCADKLMAKGVVRE